DDQLYGYLWWLGRSRLNGREVHWVGALGRGGQSIRIVPELDLVVIVTAGYYQDYSPQAFQVRTVFSGTYCRRFRLRAELKRHHGLCVGTLTAHQSSPNRLLALFSDIPICSFLHTMGGGETTFA